MDNSTRKIKYDYIWNYQILFSFTTLQATNVTLSLYYTHSLNNLVCHVLKQVRIYRLLMISVERTIKDTFKITL